MASRQAKVITALAVGKPTQIRRYSKFDLFGDMPIPPNKQKFIPKSGTYPQGFRIGSINIGIKPATRSQPDLVLVASDKPSCGAAVFTKNEFAAPSITVSRDILHKSGGRGLKGVIANSWCANLLTGPVGLEDSKTMSQAADQQISGEDAKGKSSSVMVMHTGLGGQRLPIDNIVENIPNLYQGMGNSHDHWLEAAKGMLTTDTFPKLASRTFTLPSWPSTTFSFAGITKGAGMVHPNMATTLAILCTDAPVSAEALQQALSVAADKSYNCISIDGDTSTNDMVALLANGAAVDDTRAEITFEPSAASQSADFVAFQKSLIEFMADLAKLVVRDGEGASKFITIRVRGAPSYAAGKHIASVIARSVLVRTGIYGGDPNWGGIMIALGYSLIGTEFAGKGIIEPGLTSVSFVPADGSETLKFLDKGMPSEVDESRVKEVMALEDIEVVVDLRDDGEESSGAEEAVYWTCDLTHEFVTINGDFAK